MKPAQEREDRHTDPWAVAADRLGLQIPLRPSEAAEEPSDEPSPLDRTASCSDERHRVVHGTAEQLVDDQGDAIAKVHE